MKKIFKKLGYLFLCLLVLALFAGIFFLIKWNRTSSANMELLGEPAKTLTENGYEFQV